ncbi:hypothetical protein [Caulobacter sp. FWC2]|nr:hypothetical protein [Caulobacter sp. FWC2]
MASTDRRPLRHDACPHRATSPVARVRRKRPLSPAPLAGEVARRRQAT